MKTLQRIEEGRRELRLSELDVLAELTDQDVSFFGITSSLPAEGVEVSLPPPLPLGNPQQ